MQHGLKTIFIANGIAVTGLCLGGVALAQVTPDSSLPTNSVVDLPACNAVCTITGGTVQGSNLFHSFTDFSLPTGSTAAFNEAVDITTIIG